MFDALLDWLSHANNAIGILTFGFTVVIWWRLRRIRRAAPKAAGEEIVVVFDVQGNPAKMVSDLSAAGYPNPKLIIEAQNVLGGDGLPVLDRSSGEFEKLARFFFEKIGPFSASSILLAYNGPAALSFAIGQLAANNFDIVQLHFDRETNRYQQPPRSSADWRHWSGI